MCKLKEAVLPAFFHNNNSFSKRQSGRRHVPVPQQYQARLDHTWRLVKVVLWQISLIPHWVHYFWFYCWWKGIFFFFISAKLLYIGILFFFVFFCLQFMFSGPCSDHSSHSCLSCPYLSFAPNVFIATIPQSKVLSNMYRVLLMMICLHNSSLYITQLDNNFFYILHPFVHVYIHHTVHWPTVQNCLLWFFPFLQLHNWFILTPV